MRSFQCLSLYEHEHIVRFSNVDCKNIADKRRKSETAMAHKNKTSEYRVDTT